MVDPVDEPIIEVTDAMLAAGLAVAWSAPKPPDFVVQQVRRIYEAMERARRKEKH